MTKVLIPFLSLPALNLLPRDSNIHPSHFVLTMKKRYSTWAQLHQPPIEPDVEVQPHIQPGAEREPLDPEAAPEPKSPLDPEAALELEPPHAPESILVPSDREEESIQQHHDSSPEPEAYVAHRGRVDRTHMTLTGGLQTTFVI